MSFKEVLIKEYENRSRELENQIDECSLLIKKKKNELDDINDKVNAKSSEIEIKKIDIEKLDANIIKLKNELTDLNESSESQYIIAYPDNSVSIAKEYELEEVSTIELKEFNKLIENLEKKKAVSKLTKDEYKELLKSKDYSGIPLPDKYYKSPRRGIFWAQMHIRGITPEEYEDYKSKKIPLWKAIRNHSMHVDLRCSFTRLKRLFQMVLVEDSIDSYLRVMKGSVDPNTKQVSKGLGIIKLSAMEPKERLKEKKEMLLDEAGAKKVVDLIIESKSYFIEPGKVGATSKTYAYMGAIVLGKVESGTMREDFKELFLHPEGENKDLWNGRFIFKAFKMPRHLWWIFEAIKTPTPCNPYCEIDSGNFKLLPAERLKHFKKEDYDSWRVRKDEC